ncbi:hypothetical protein B7494_g4559 [Chlorociboria aeruginascens]|nr:hypothetical protein B7494_g4559 [Chlorociboria aeruginascens]
MATDTDIQQTPFVKQLAANDRPTRDAALHSLRTYLSGRRELPPLDLLKLWKGLFYCLWMSDRPLTQQALASSLASLVSILPSPTTVPFLRAFWQTMAREWTGIDVLRMEKFLLLVRRYVAAHFEVLDKNGWKEEGQNGITEVMGLMGEVALNVGDMRISNGLRFHVIDVWVDEMERAGILELEKPVVEALLGPLRTLVKASPNKVVRRKAKEALEDERLPGNEKPVGGNEDQDVEVEGNTNEDGWEGIED